MENGQCVRRSTLIDIPLVYDMPHFAKDDSLPEDDPLHGDFVLVLQSFLCHQGTRTDSGHYISAARRPGSGNGTDRWLLMDDLAKERISYIDDIRKFLDKEKPYLLFYRVEPVSSGPPPYQEPADKDSGVAGLSTSQSSSYGSKNQEALITGRHSLDSSLPKHKRGRTSVNNNRPQSLISSNGNIEGSKPNQNTFLSLGTEQNSSTVSRRGSKLSTAGSMGRASSKRSSMSLSRLAERLSKEKSNASLSGRESTAAQSKISSRPPTSEGSKAPEITKPLDAKGKYATNGDRHGMVGRHKADKPERECVVM